MEVKLFDSIDEAKLILPNNQPKLVKAMGRNICVVRKEDEYFAFENECPHMGESLHRGAVNYLTEIVCPLHAYRFNLHDGRPIEKNCRSLRLVQVKVKNGIFLEI